MFVCVLLLFFFKSQIKSENSAITQLSGTCVVESTTSASEIRWSRSRNTTIKYFPSYRQLGALQRRLFGGSDGVGVQSQTTDQRHTQEATPHPHPPIDRSITSLSTINHWASLYLSLWGEERFHDRFTTIYSFHYFSVSLALVYSFKIISLFDFSKIVF